MDIKLTMPQTQVKWRFDLKFQEGTQFAWREGDEPWPAAQLESFSADIQMVDGKPVSVSEEAWPEYNADGAAWTWKVKSLVANPEKVKESLFTYTFLLLLTSLILAAGKDPNDPFGIFPYRCKEGYESGRGDV